MRADDKDKAFEPEIPGELVPGMSNTFVSR
jgi:hypothetical protein